ncbi:MAG TPA: selenium-dependent molybdenum cofactor biosynthesis protein YqeB [Chloroflexota bacterium]|nr:selenium-dependent molybdenum cofactor biosynthesis protein YqeB [Chloroflexota bacterium]HZU04393.1 selenium-dependent molybdenum cofactor biosynthesis protein YqeB [Chloroflexota bacterium]
MSGDGLTVIKGAGDLATGVAVRLYRAGLRLLMTEIAAPTAVRRTVAFAEAVYAGTTTVEGITARYCRDLQEAEAALAAEIIPVLVDPEATVVRELRPTVVIDAIMAKQNLGTRLTDAPVVIGVGPGFVAGRDVHAVVETQRGHYLGRAIYEGAAAPDTGVPGVIGGFAQERVLRAPAAGHVEQLAAIGAQVEAGETVALVSGQPVRAAIRGTLRGLIHAGVAVHAGMKIGDIDPRAEPAHCFTVSDKSLAVGGGALEAVLYLVRQRCPEQLYNLFRRPPEGSARGGEP